MDKQEPITISELAKDLKVDLTDRDVDILITLSDNKGHTRQDLEDTVIDSKKIGSYASERLNILSYENFGDLTDSISIQSYHIKDPLSLAHKIKDQRDSISKYIFKNMNNMWLEKLFDTNPDAIELFLPMGLNELLSDMNFYNKERFRGVELSERAKKLIERKEELKEVNIRILNRVLIADAYPNEIYKTRISLIHQLSRRGYNNSEDRYFINLDLRAFNFIVGHLKDEIIWDRNELGFLEAKYKKYMKSFGVYAKEFDSPELQKLIKHGKYDITFFKSRYERRISNLWKFMTSNYVRNIKDKYSNKDILLPLYGFPSNEFDLIKYLNFREDGLILEEEINGLETILNNK